MVTIMQQSLPAQRDISSWLFPFTMSEPTPFKHFVMSPAFVSDVVEIFPFTYVHVFSMKYVSQRVARPLLLLSYHQFRLTVFWGVAGGGIRCRAECCVTMYNDKILNSVQIWLLGFSAMYHVWIGRACAFPPIQTERATFAALRFPYSPL